MAKEGRRVYGPAAPDYADDQPSPLLLYNSHRNHRGASVFKRAALAGKRKIWDSNDASIDAAQSAVDQWEAAYSALRGLLLASGHTAQGLYRAAKAGTHSLEHGLLLPVRDWILLPAFFGAERIAGETVGFLQSDQAAHLAGSSLAVVKKVPFVGDGILAPALLMGVDWTQKAWEIIQYPIPSKAAVRDSVDHVLTGTKWALSTAGREVYFYAKRMDANITRTLMHTQWRVLGSGPYSTLDDLHKSEILDHLCERYFSLPDAISRYELAAHIRAHNRHLYHDLVVTGVLRERGGELTQEDEWLSLEPSYRSLESPFLLDPSDQDVALPLWFRLPYHNGKRPGKDVPWVCLSGTERRKLEEKYLSVVHSCQDGDSCFVAGQQQQLAVEKSVEADHPPSVLKQSSTGSVAKYETIAHWYEPDLEKDVLVDQRRHAVSFLPTCPQCGATHTASRPPLNLKRYGDFCENCSKGRRRGLDGKFSPPPLAGIMRPTMWRFHGPGDEMRRGVWFLDTKRAGLQPYSDESAAILEDAYLFLKWRAERGERDDDIEGALLTVEVTSPDDKERQLVQFSSLTAATAIQKTLGGAISIFKRRVYRGACLHPAPSNDDLSVASNASRVSSNDDNNTPVGLRPLNSGAAAVDDMESEAAQQLIIKDKKQVDSKTTLAIRISDLQQNDVCEEEWPEKDIDHLVLIIHGIGEMLQSVDVFGLALPNMSSIVDCCGFLRKNHVDIQTVQTKLATRGRVEYLPVEWHEAFALRSQRGASLEAAQSLPPGRLRSPNATMNDVSLRTIPQMRAFANDTLMDVLYFMSPAHHDIIIDIVTHEMNDIVNRVYELTNFSGKVSVMGHSLGSVIAWDILANQLPSITKRDNDDLVSMCPEILPAGMRMADALKPDQEAAPTELSSVSLERSDSEDTSLSEAVWTYPQLAFAVDNAFMVGSPIPVFLMIRNQLHPLSQDFSLKGCSRVFNIFHPYDPVAYRIEPLLNPRNADVEPRIMTHWNGGFRMQYHTKRLWKKIVNETLRTQQNVIDSLEDRMTRLGLLDSNFDSLADENDDDEEDINDHNSDDSSSARRVVCGNLNEGRRIDYMLQEREIEHANEYVAALAAHSSYWIEKDLSLFVAQQILHSTIAASTSYFSDNGSTTSF